MAYKIISPFRKGNGKKECSGNYNHPQEPPTCRQNLMRNQRILRLLSESNTNSDSNVSSDMAELRFPKWKRIIHRLMDGII